MTTAPSSSAWWKTLRDRIDAQYRADIAALARLRQLHEERKDVEIERPSFLAGSTHLAMLLMVMKTDDSRAWSVPELSSATGIPQSAIRTVLYTKQSSHFEREEIVPKIVKWRLKQAAKATA